MRKTKTIKGAFYTNGLYNAYPLVSVDEDWWISYTKKSTQYKIAPTGTTYATTSPVLVDSDTSAITLTPETATFTASGETEQLAVVNQDTTDVISECTFASDDEGVATVSATGLITAVAAGTCTITATHNDGPTDTCDVTFS